MIKSRRELARRLGLPDATLRSRMSSTVFPWRFKTRGPWSDEDLAEIRKWFSLTFDMDPEDRVSAGRGASTMTPLAKARAASAFEDAQLKRLRRKQLEGSVHDVAECNERVMRMIWAIKGRLHQQPASLAPRLVGLSANEIEEVLETENMGMLREFAVGVGLPGVEREDVNGQA